MYKTVSKKEKRNSFLYITQKEIENEITFEYSIGCKRNEFETLLLAAKATNTMASISLLQFVDFLMDFSKLNVINIYTI